MLLIPPVFAGHHARQYLYPRKSRIWTVGTDYLIAKIGAGAGILAGLLLGGPIGGLAAGAAIGAITGKMEDYGIDDKFIKEISAGLGYNSSAIFLLVKEARGEEVMERLKPYKGVVLSTTLAPEAQARLEQALSKEEF